MLSLLSRAAQTPKLAKVFCFFPSEKKTCLALPCLGLPRAALRYFASE
jgi:hypothetical protein